VKEPQTFPKLEETKQMPRASQKKILRQAGFTSLPMQTDVEPPALVRKDPIATSAWHLAVDQLQRQNRFQNSDRIAIERYAILASLARRYSEDCQNTKGYQTTQSGYRQLAAELSCLLKTSKELLTLEKGLGLNPTAREDAGVSHEEFDELEEFIAAG
jgi:phage terminase small subunit